MAHVFAARALLPDSEAGDLGSEDVSPEEALAAATATHFRSATAALGGVLIASHIGQINFYIGFIAGIKAFVAAVLGIAGLVAGASAGFGPASGIDTFLRSSA